MNASTSGPSEFRPQTGLGRGIAGVREVIEQFRSPDDRRVDVQLDRTGVREDVLAALLEQPANGYQIVRLLGERARDGRAPTAGSVYPALQLLGDEGLATAEDLDGRKTWTLTPAGRVAAEAVLDRPGPATAAPGRAPERRGALVRTSAQLAQTAALAAQTSTPDQISEVVAALDEARRKILQILARS